MDEKDLERFDATAKKYADGLKERYNSMRIFGMSEQVKLLGFRTSECAQTTL